MDAPRTITARKPRRLRTILTTALLTTALVAPTTAVAASGLLDAGDGVLVRDSSTGRLVEATVADGQWVLKPRAAEPTAPPTTTPPTQVPASADLKVTRSADGTTASASWNRAITGAVVGRDGRDSTGYGAWTSAPGVAQPAVFRQLIPASAYKVTVSGQLDGKAVTQTVEVAAVTAPTTPPVTSPPVTSPPVTSPPATSPPATGGKTPGWLSGQSGTSRGAGEITATWSDNDSAARDMSKFNPGGEFGSWCGSVDLAVGAFDRGETWAGVAGGSNDADWKASTQAIRTAWTGLQNRCATAGDTTPNTLFVRFAHEANGNWYPWAFGNTDPAVVKRAYARYAGVLDAALPQAKLVMSMNRESVSMSRPWTDYFPGNTVIDVMNVDYYNQFPAVSTKAQWDASMGTMSNGPKGLQAHLDFARSVGLPLSLGEWSGNADSGDYTVFVEQMYDFFKRNAGSGAGQLLYEVQFNVDKDDRRWLLTPGNTRMPQSASTYQRLFVG